MINFKKMTQIKEDDKYKKVDIKFIQLLERLQVGARSLSYFKFFENWGAIGFDAIRRILNCMRRITVHSKNICYNK